MNRLRLAVLSAVIVAAAVAGVFIATQRHHPQSASSTTTTRAPSGSTDTSPTSTSSTTTSTLPPPPSASIQRGIDVWWVNNPTGDPLPFVEARSDQIVTYIKDLHANAVDVAFPIYTESRTSDTVFADPDTPSVQEIAEFISVAQQAKLRVTLRPLLNVGTVGYGWRGEIHPHNLQAFFASYADALRPYLELAQQMHVPTFIYASEFVSLSGQYFQKWSYLLSRMTPYYHGQLEYDSSGGSYLAQGNHIPGYDDYTDAYFAVDAGPSAGTTTIYNSWLHSLGGLPTAVLRRTIFQEVGFAAIPNGYKQPATVISGGTDPNYLYMQRRWFTAVCRVVQHLHIAGVYFWTIYFKVDPLVVPPLAQDDPTTWMDRPGASAIASCFQGLSRS
jgi:hypothetical protein